MAQNAAITRRSHGKPEMTVITVHVVSRTMARILPSQHLAHHFYRCFLWAREGIMAGFLARMLRAALLDTALYEEVEADSRATWQAVGVVLLSSLASGLGSGARDGVRGVVVHTLVVLIAWYTWAYLSYFIGATFLPEAQTRANHGELLRTLGFSSAPGILRL